ncbi:MAG: DUF933 domain-containing protein [Planctomycetota bacterium]
MRIGIVGLPLSGKTSFFHALGSAGTRGSGAQIHLANVKVPDARLEWLRDLYKPKKYTPATLDFLDIPGMAFEREAKEGAKEGPSTGSVLSQVRSVDTLAVVLDGFSEDAKPAEAFRNILSELALADLTAIQGKIERAEKELVKSIPNRDKIRAEIEILQKGVPALERNEAPTDSEFLRAAASFALLMLKPVFPILNVAEKDLGKDRSAEIPPFHGQALCLCAKLEAELMEMEEADRTEMMREYGLAELALPRVIRRAYDRAGLISFFTVGEDEVRAWTIKKGDNAVTAAGKIHTDLARGFIRAEVVPYEDFRALGSMKAVKEKGKLRLDGKEAVIHDGEIINVRFSV